MIDTTEQYDAVVANLNDTFDRGLASKELCFFESSRSLYEEGGIEFSIRLCPALSRKSKGYDPTRANSPETTPQGDDSPFLPPYKQGLYLGAITEDDEPYVALLNKYSVVKHHYLLITKDYMPQTSPLSPDSLTAAYKLILAAQRKERPYFMFFNCGYASGASQGHKHMQFLPLDNFPAGLPIERLAARQQLESDSKLKAFSIYTLPWANHIIRLPTDLGSAPTDVISDTLQEVYIRLLDLTMLTFIHQPGDGYRGPKAYNVIMTLNHMHMVPRAKGEYTLSNGDVLPVNALGFAGLFMVKCPEEDAALRRDTVFRVLEATGLPDAQGQSCSAVEMSLKD